MVVESSRRILTAIMYASDFRLGVEVFLVVTLLGKVMHLANLHVVLNLKPDECKHDGSGGGVYRLSLGSLTDTCQRLDEYGKPYTF